MSGLVYYCPGDSIGSPAHMTWNEADNQFVKDARMVRILGFMTGDPTSHQNSPHINGECERCKPQRPFPRFRGCAHHGDNSWYWKNKCCVSCMAKN
jgi:hypothetical protein